MSLERDVIALRLGHTQLNQQLAELRRERESNKQYIQSQAKLYIAVQDENRVLRRMVRDMAKIFGDDE